jgi:hypothetical protein
MPFGIGFFATVGALAPVGGPAFDLLQTEILTGSQASVTFSSLGDYAANYQHLQIRAVVRSVGSRSDGGSQGYIRINADTGSNYNFHNMWGNGSSVQSSGSAEAGIWAGWMPAANAPANAFGSWILDLLDPFETSKNKTVRFLHGAPTYNEVSIISGMRRNTEAITSVTILDRLGSSYAAGTRFSLYGLRK